MKISIYDIAILFHVNLNSCIQTKLQNQTTCIYIYIYIYIYYNAITLRIYSYI